MTNPIAPEAMFEEGGLSALWRRIRSYWRPERVATAEALKVYVQERASFIAQKCAVDYCRGKTGLASYALFTEEPFLKAFDVCRWEAFATLLGDLFILAEGQVRDEVPPELRDRLCDAFIKLHRTVLANTPLPVHRQDGWDDVMGAFVLRMQQASRGEPRRALDVADHSAKRLFDTLPIHISMRVLDEEVVYGAVRFRMIAISQEMQRRIDAPALAGSLLNG